jgi:hypothetical protein
MGEGRGAYGVFVGRPDGKILLKRPRHRQNISKWIFKKWEGEVRTGLLWLRIWTGGRYLCMW